MKRIGSGQIVGARARQEDAIGSARARDEALALVLADGMGGHAGGDVASRTAVRAVLAHLKTAKRTPAEELKPALQAANDDIRRAAEADGALNDMGCTLVAATIRANRLRWISVGDSVLFLLRGKQLSRLNADHSMRAVFDEMVSRGQMTRAEANSDPTRNALRSAVSGDEIELVDFPDTDFILQSGDLVLLVSDGVETLDDEDIARVALAAVMHGAQRVADDLLRAVTAQKAEHQDNASVLAYIHGGGRRAISGQRSPVITVAIAAAVVLLGWTAWLVAPAQHRIATVTHGAPPKPVRVKPPLKNNSKPKSNEDGHADRH